MDVPAEQEGGVAAECYSSNEGVPGGVEEELYQGEDLEEES